MISIWFDEDSGVIVIKTSRADFYPAKSLGIVMNNDRITIRNLVSQRNVVADMAFDLFRDRDARPFVNANAVKTYLDDLVVQEKRTEQKKMAFSSSDEWIVNHDLGRIPTTTIIDSAGSHLMAEIDHISLNSLTVKFSYPTSGEIYLT